MNIKILETKLQTIFENDLFAVTEENIKERILIELDFILQRIADEQKKYLSKRKEVLSKEEKKKQL